MRKALANVCLTQPWEALDANPIATRARPNLKHLRAEDNDHSELSTPPEDGPGDHYLYLLASP